MFPVKKKLAARDAQSKAFGGAVVKAAARKSAPPKASAPKGHGLAAMLGPPSPGGKDQGPRTNINYKDLPPDEQDQLAKKAGLQPGPTPAPPGVVTAPEAALAASQPRPAPAEQEKGEDPAEEAQETPDQEAAEQSKSDLSPPKGHHAVAAHVRRNPVVSKVGAEKLKRRGVPLT